MSGRAVLVKQGHAQQPASPWLWWWREFPGVPEQVREVRHWMRGLLSCDPFDDLLTITSEFATNALAHTRSGRPDGTFGVQVAWSPDTVRVAVGDGGAASVPTVIQDSTGTGGRGLAWSAN
jgi:anti-sigma regulatory factor (Ser/Thr protein kinase)